MFTVNQVAQLIFTKYNNNFCNNTPVIRCVIENFCFNVPPPPELPAEDPSGMERYEHVAIVGEGSYGLVVKCKHKESGQMVAVKKFLETEEDAGIRKMALREIRMLKKLKHENMVTMIEVFRHRKRFYIVFEYLTGTVLDVLEKEKGGLGEEKSREFAYQVVRAIVYCHSKQIIHRDVKPENILISKSGVIKLCDFGFARVVSSTTEPITEYVATRWYRAPELLVGDKNYGAPVDIWAIGCLMAEMLTGNALFPGQTDIDQLYLIGKLIGKLCPKHRELLTKNFVHAKFKDVSQKEFGGLEKAFAHFPNTTVNFMSCCLNMDPEIRSTADELLSHAYFTHDNYPAKILPIIRERVIAELSANPLLEKFKDEIVKSTDEAHGPDAKKDRRVTRASNARALNRRVSQAETHRWNSDDPKNVAGNSKACHEKRERIRCRKTYRDTTGLSFLKSKKKIPCLVTEKRVLSQRKKVCEAASSSSSAPSTPSATDNEQESSSRQLDAKISKRASNLMNNVHDATIRNVLNRNIPHVPNDGRYFTRQQAVVRSNGEAPACNNVFVNIEPLHLRRAHANPLGKKKLNGSNVTLPNLACAKPSPNNDRAVKTQNKNKTDTPDSSNVTPEVRYRRSKRKHSAVSRPRKMRK